MWQDCNTNSLDMIFKSEFFNLNAAVSSSSMPAFTVKDSAGGGGAGGHGDKTKGVAADQVQGPGAASNSNSFNPYSTHDANSLGTPADGSEPKALRSRRATPLARGPTHARAVAVARPRRSGQGALAPPQSQPPPTHRRRPRIGAARARAPARVDDAYAYVPGALSAERAASAADRRGRLPRRPRAHSENASG